MVIIKKKMKLIIILNRKENDVQLWNLQIRSFIVFISYPSR